MRDQELPQKSHKKDILMHRKAEDIPAFGLAASPYWVPWVLGFWVIVHEVFRSVITEQAKCPAS